LSGAGVPSGGGKYEIEFYALSVRPTSSWALAPSGNPERTTR
jgi:hypothetical protein